MPTYDDPTPDTSGPGQRGRPVRARSGGRTTRVLVDRNPGSGIGPTPDPGPGPFEDKPPSDLSPSLNNRLAAQAADREISVHPAEGPVEEQFGGPLKRGGKVIYFRDFSAFWLIDFALGEGAGLDGTGPVYDTIDTFRWGDKSNSDLNIVVEPHYGAAGDTGSTLINAHDPTYARPEGIASVVVKCPLPTVTTGPYNPFDFTCIATRGTYTDPVGATVAPTSVPSVAAYYAMRLYNSYDHVYENDWVEGQFICQTDIGGGVNRWEFALLVDTIDSLENWVKVLLSYCFGHVRYNNGKFGAWFETPRGHAFDSDGQPILFADYDFPDDTDPNSDYPFDVNTSAPITYVQKGASEVPTVCITHYTDFQTTGFQKTFLDSSVQTPDPLDSGTPWRPAEIFMPGIQTIERARRWNSQWFNTLQLADKDITIPAWEDAILALPGDRVQVRSQLLIAPGDSPPNSEAFPGSESVTIIDIKLGDSPIVRAVPYRDAMFGDTIDTSDPPNGPPDPPDPDADPDCPLSVDSPHANSSEYGMIVVEPPADETIIAYYDVVDLISGSSVGVINPPADPPLSGDGKYHKTFPTAVHYDSTTGTYSLSVRVDSVSFAGNRGSGCSTTSWDVTVGVSTGTNIESAEYTFTLEGVGDTGYDPNAYTKVVDVTKEYSTTIDDPTNDFFLIPSGNAQGVICPKMDGWFRPMAGGLWQANPDTGYRAIAIAILGLSGNVGLHTGYLTIDNAGAFYLTGEELTFTGGSLATGGFHGAGVIIASGGAIVGISLSEPMIGWLTEPTIGVATAGGTGAVITFHLPAAFTFADLNFDCASDPLGHAKGAIWKEEIKGAVNGILTSSSVNVQASMHLGDGLLIGLQQGSGATLDMYDETSSTAINARKPRISIFRLPPAAPLAEQYAECPPPE